MDATFLAVSRLREQGYSIRGIARKLNISGQKVQKILITIGEMETVESAMLRQGLSPVEIAAQLGKSENAVTARLPYIKTMYDAEYPTKNALRIRKSREKKRAD